MTNAEKLLWSHLRNKQLGVKFRRQFSVGEYITDFYCPNLKLAVEVDGGQHYTKEGIEYDNKRTEYLNSIKIEVVRYTNIDILMNIDRVLIDLAKIINSKKQPLPASP